jgi:hypothetical protein
VPLCACCGRFSLGVMQPLMARTNPQQKTFKLPWGSGFVEEEVQIEAKWCPRTKSPFGRSGT